MKKSYVKLRRITPTRVANTYDITVQDKHRLIANGFYTSNCWHSDVLEFITAKQTPGRLTKFNMSVNCTDDFMAKVTGADPDDNWDLRYPVTTHPDYKEKWDGNIKKWENAGLPVKVYKTVSAKWLWNLIMMSCYNRAEPGVLFLDRANHYNPLYYGETIAATNPCLTGETLVYVADGRHNVTIKDLADSGEDVPVFCYDDDGNVSTRMMRAPRKTGTAQPVFSVLLDDGNVLRATGNHKFRLSDKSYKRVDSLSHGDSLCLMSRTESVMIKAGKNYAHLRTGNKMSATLEHRLIAAFHNNIDKIPTGMVVHHLDYNPLNNSPDNLVLLTKKEHDAIHANDRVGDNNPMRRAQSGWNDAKWQTYHDNMSAAVAGEKNGNANGVTNEELKEHALFLTKTVQRRFSTVEWYTYATVNNLPKSFTKWRTDHLGGVIGLAKWAASVLGFDNVTEDPRLQRRYVEETSRGYNVVIKNSMLYYIKKCEICGEEFLSIRKEHGVCSSDACKSEHNKRTQTRPEVMAKREKNTANTFARRAAILREKQSEVFNTVKLNLCCVPMKKEWMKACKDSGISAEIGRKGSPFQSYDELKQYASTSNHKVVSVTFDGYEDVYNGTVDEFHNFFVGGFTCIDTDGNNKTLYFNNLQCGEQTLAPSGVCCLGSVNLTQFVDVASGKFDFAGFEKHVAILVRMLDNVNTVSAAPLPEYKWSMENKRRVGVGVSGWGSALLMMRKRFASKEALELQHKIASAYAKTAYKASIELAKERGMFSVCDPVKHADGAFVRGLFADEPEVLDDIRKYGIRNSSLLSCQPTGTTSIFAGLISGGIEPPFSFGFTRTSIVANIPEELRPYTPEFWESRMYETEVFKWHMEGDEKMLRGEFGGSVYKIDSSRGLTRETECLDYGVRKMREAGKWDETAPWASTALSLTVEDHVKDLQGWARFVDSAISKTVNIPNDYSFDDFQKVYLDAYNSVYIKGITTYRAGTMASVLSVKEEKEGFEEEIILEDAKFPDKSNATMSCLKAEGKKWYLTTVLGADSDRPIALFVQTNSREKTVVATDAAEKLIALAREKGIPEKWVLDTEAKIEHSVNCEKIARAISLNLRHGVLIKSIVERLGDVEGALVGTFCFQIKKFLSQYIKDGEPVTNNGACPECGSHELIYTEGCVVCKSCGNSKCG